MKNIHFEEKIKLSNYTTIKVGGFAEYFSKPRNRDEFINLIKWANLNNYKCRINHNRVSFLNHLLKQRRNNLLEPIHSNQA